MDPLKEKKKQMVKARRLAEAMAKVELPQDTFTLANIRWSNARRFAKPLYQAQLIILLLSMVAVLAGSIGLLRQPKPQLLVSYPDGAVVCAGNLRHPGSWVPEPRPGYAVKMCAGLEAEMTTSVPTSSAPTSGGRK